MDSDVRKRAVKWKKTALASPFFTGKVRCARSGPADGDLQIEEEVRNDSE